MLSRAAAQRETIAGAEALMKEIIEAGAVVAAEVDEAEEVSVVVLPASKEGILN